MWRWSHLLLRVDNSGLNKMSYFSPMHRLHFWWYYCMHQLNRLMHTHYMHTYYYHNFLLLSLLQPLLSSSAEYQKYFKNYYCDKLLLLAATTICEQTIYLPSSVYNQLFTLVLQCRTSTIIISNICFWFCTRETRVDWHFTCPSFSQWCWAATFDWFSFT